MNRTASLLNDTRNVYMTTKEDIFLLEITPLLPVVAIAVVIINTHFFITLCIQRSGRKKLRYITLVSLIFTDLSFGCSLLLTVLVRHLAFADLCIRVDTITRVLKMSSNIHVPIILAERCFNIYKYDEKPRSYPMKSLFMRIALIWSIVLVTCLPIITCTFRFKYEVTCSFMPMREKSILMAMKYSSILFVLCLISSFVCSFIMCLKIFQNLKFSAKVHNCSFVKSCNTVECRIGKTCATKSACGTAERTSKVIEPVENVNATSEIPDPTKCPEGKQRRTRETKLSDTSMEQIGLAKRQIYISDISIANPAENTDQNEKYGRIYYLKQKRLRHTILVIIVVFFFHSILFLPLHILNCLIGFDLSENNINIYVWILCHQLNCWQSIFNPFLFILSVKELRDRVICCNRSVLRENINHPEVL